MFVAFVVASLISEVPGVGSFSFVVVAAAVPYFDEIVELSEPRRRRRSDDQYGCFLSPLVLRDQCMDLQEI